MTYVNEGVWDRAIRILLSVALAYTAWMLWPGTLSAVLFVVAAVALATCISGWCLLYALFEISTNKKVVS